MGVKNLEDVLFYLYLIVVVLGFCYLIFLKSDDLIFNDELKRQITTIEELEK